MSITITDPSLLEQLFSVTGPVELHNPQGIRIGVFEADTGKLPPGVQSPFTDAEMAERRKIRTGRPLKDILRELESRPRQ